MFFFLVLATKPVTGVTGRRLAQVQVIPTKLIDFVCGLRIEICLEVTVEIQNNADVVFDKASKVVFDSGYSKTAVDKTRRRLRIDTGIGAVSWGEIIEIFAEPLGEGRSLLRIRATRKVPVNITSDPDSIARNLSNKIVAECSSSA